MLDGLKSLAFAYDKLNIPDSAAFYVNKAFNLARKNKQILSENEMMRLAADLSFKEGDYKKAFELLKKVQCSNDSLTNAERLQQLKQWEILYDNLVVEESSIFSRMKPQHIFYVMGGLVLILGIVIAVLWHIKKIHTIKLLEISAKQKSDSEVINENHRILLSSALEKCKTDEFINDLSERLKKVLLEINPRSTAQKQELRQLIANLNRFTNRDNWAEYHLFGGPGKRQAQPCKPYGEKGK